jgi:hypothetical protein
MAPHWRKPREPRPDPATDPAEREQVERALLELNEQLKAAAPADGEVRVKDADFVIVESKVPRRLGKWAIVPPEATSAKNEDPQPILDED